MSAMELALEKALIGQITLHLLLKYEQLLKDQIFAINRALVFLGIKEVTDSCRRQLQGDGLDKDQIDKIMIRATHLAREKIEKAILERAREAGKPND